MPKPFCEHCAKIIKKRMPHNNKQDYQPLGNCGHSLNIHPTAPCPQCMRMPNKQEECCEKCKCINFTKDHQFVRGTHFCDNTICPCHQPPKQGEEWEKEFECLMVNYNSEIIEEDRLKDFIYTLLQKGREDMVREIERDLERIKVKAIYDVKPEVKEFAEFFVSETKKAVLEIIRKV